MTEPRRLMCVFAHPDDETLSAGGILAKYAAEGVETYLICATRGERGWGGKKKEEYPGLVELGKIREAELHSAAGVLGIKEVVFLDYIDGELDKASPREAAARIAAHLVRVRPQVVVTADPQGSYGHPDHVALTQLTLAAILEASPSYKPAKFYYVAETQTTLSGLEEAIGKFHITLDGTLREAAAWPDWLISAEVDTSAYWGQVVRALECHRTQIAHPEHFLEISQRLPPAAWGIRAFYRAYSLVNGGRAKEKDLFEGIC
jgi:LmbE family N-acetylglucosaminyl deacetylase